MRPAGFVGVGDPGELLPRDGDPELRAEAAAEVVGRDAGPADGAGDGLMAG